MRVQFLVLDTCYYNGTEKGIEEASKNAILVEDTIKVDRKDKSAVDKAVEEVINKWRKKYPKNLYDFVDIRWS